MKSGQKKQYLAQYHPDPDKVERSFLAALCILIQLKHQNRAQSVIDMADECLFHNPVLKCIYICIRELIGKSDINGFTIETQASSFHAKEMILPRREFLVQCSEMMTSEFSGDGCESYLDIMRQNYVKRRVRYLGETLRENESMPADEHIRLVDEAAMEIKFHGTSITQENTPKQDLGNFLDTIEARMKGGEKEDYNDFICQFDGVRSNGGSWNKGNNLVVQAMTNVGKTTFGLNIVGEQADTYGKPGLIFSFEMTYLEIYAKLIARIARVEWTSILSGKLTSQEFARVANAVPKVCKIKIERDLELSPREIISKIRFFKQKMGIEWYMLDYFQNVTYNSEDDRQLTEMERFSRDLKKLSIREELFGVIISQTNDDGKIKNCRSLGHDQDDIVSLRKGRSEREVISKWIKRRGAKKNFDVPLAFNGEFSLFENMP